MAQRRSPSSKPKSSKTKSSKTKSSRAKSSRGKAPAAKAKAAKTKTKSMKSKVAAPKRAAPKKKKPVAKTAAGKKAAAKIAKTKRPAAAKPAPRRTAPAIQGRRPRRTKGGRPPGFERTAKIGVETRTEDLLPNSRSTRESPRPLTAPDGYVYESDARQSADETFTPGNLVPGNVGEAKPAPRRRGVSRSSETESIPAEGAAATAGPAKGSFDEAAAAGQGNRDAEIAGQQRDSAVSAPNEDYGRAKTSDRKANE